MNEKLIEVLADNEHDRWSKWQGYMFSKCIKNEDGPLTIPKELVLKWQRQLSLKYQDLSELEKDADRKEAYKILKILENAKNENN